MKYNMLFELEDTDTNKVPFEAADELHEQLDDFVVLRIDSGQYVAEEVTGE